MIKRWESESNNLAPVSPPASKGFGAPKIVKKEEEKPKDEGTIVYENQAKRGVPEYNIFLRPKNGTETEWVPVGSMTIPRDKKPAQAIFEVENELLKGTFKLYPKLKAFYELRGSDSKIFDYGYCLKAFPDEPIKVAEKNEVTKNANFFSSWFDKLTSPIDNSELKNRGQMTIKQ